MTTLNGHELRMLKSFKTSSRFWRTVPDRVFSLCEKGLVKPTKFGRGNFQLTDEGRQYLKSLES